MKTQDMNAYEEQHWRVLGMCIWARRKALGWSQQDLAEATGLSRTEIQYIQAGRSRLLIHSNRGIAP